jgi:sec-independent protein translocase protein TatA
MIGGLGSTELIIIFALVLIIFGPKSIPKIAQSLGRGIREFKDATSGIVNEDYADDYQEPAQIVNDEQAVEMDSEPASGIAKDKGQTETVTASGRKHHYRKKA